MKHALIGVWMSWASCFPMCAVCSVSSLSDLKIWSQVVWIMVTSVVFLPNRSYGSCFFFGFFGVLFLGVLSAKRWKETKGSVFFLFLLKGDEIWWSAFMGNRTIWAHTRVRGICWSSGVACWFAVERTSVRPAHCQFIPTRWGTMLSLLN